MPRTSLPLRLLAGPTLSGAPSVATQPPRSSHRRPPQPRSRCADPQPQRTTRPPTASDATRVKNRPFEFPIRYPLSVVSVIRSYHFGQAHLRKGVLTVQTVRHHDPEQMRSPMSAAMRGEREDSFGTEFALLRLDLASGRARWESSGLHQLEFPAFDSRFPDA